MSGSIDILHPATTLAVKTGTTVPTQIHAGGSVTITLTETNTGDTALTGVSITGTGCTSYTPAGPVSLAVGASQDFTCTFSPTDDPTAWTAAGNGTDPLGQTVPNGSTTSEYVSGSIDIINPATTLAVKTGTTVPTQIHAGDSVTITLTESNTGDTALTGVSITGTGCTS